jgi:hypothetical protein
MRYLLTAAVILALLSGATAAAPETSAESNPRGFAATVFKRELGTAESALRRAVETYDADPATCHHQIGIAISALKVSAHLYSEGSREREVAASAVEYLSVVYYDLGTRLEAGAWPPAEDTEGIKATMERIAADISTLMWGEAEKAAAATVDYEKLRAEVKENKAAGKGDIEAQIEELRAEAARLNAGAEAVEAENRQLEERAHRVNEVVDFWKTLIGEDQAFWPWR